MHCQLGSVPSVASFSLWLSPFSRKQRPEGTLAHLYLGLIETLGSPFTLNMRRRNSCFVLFVFFSWGIWILEAVPSDSLHLLYLNTSSAFVKFLLWLGNSCYWRRWGTFSSHSWRWNDLSGIIHKSLFLHLSHWNDLHHLVAQGLPPKIFPSLRLQIPKLPESL